MTRFVFLFAGVWMVASATAWAQHIAFERFVGRTQIFTMKSDGTSVQQLTNSNEDNYIPSICPNGTKIAFAREEPTPTGDDLWIMDRDGSDREPVLDEAEQMDTYPSCGSPVNNKERLAYQSHRNGNGEIWWIFTDGSSDSQVTDVTEGANDRHPEWCGDLIIFVRAGSSGESHVYTVKANGTDLTQITDEHNDDFPSCSHDTEKIAFSRCFDEEGDPATGCGAAQGSGPPRWEIMTMELDPPTTPEQITDFADSNEIQPSWSPGGTQMAFASDLNDSDAGGEIAEYEIYIMNANGTSQTQLTFNTVYDSAPDWGEFVLP